MNRWNVFACIAALLALALSLVAVFRPATFGNSAEDKARESWHAERRFPPLVFASTAWLECDISSTKNGRQAMHTMSGQGFEFDMQMLPLKESLVKLEGEGMMYKFNAFPTGQVSAKFRGLGAGTITEMKAEVEVDVKRFKQPGGPGTEIRFTADDIAPDSAYIEFTGVFIRSADAKRFPFRVLFGRATDGFGAVTPNSIAVLSSIGGKSVTIGSWKSPASVITAFYEAEDDVAVLK